MGNQVWPRWSEIAFQSMKRDDYVERNKNRENEMQVSGLVERVQNHGNNKNLKLLKAACDSMKGGVSAKRSFPTPAWRDNENEFLQQESPLGNTVLHIAARYGNDEWVHAVAREAPHLLTAKNSNGDTPLHVAAKAGYVSTLTSLLVAHIRNLPLPYCENPKEALNTVLVKNKQGNTFFHEALINGHKDAMNFLVYGGEQLEAGFKELVERAAVFQTNSENKSVLYLAIEAGDKEFVDRALAKLNSLDPALEELTKSHQELVELIPQGPDYVPEGKSPLLAAIMKRDQDILDIILTKKPEWIHLRDTEGRTPLHYAASVGFLQVVQYLLGNCISCAMEKDKDGFFPLHLASHGDHVDVVKKLLEHCPDPREILDNSGRNILHVAVQSGKINVVRYLIQAAHHDHELVKMINEKDADGNTALHLATLGCHPMIVLALTQDKRVDLTLVNGKNQTALDMFQQIPEETQSLKQRATWIALRLAGVKYGKQLTSSNSIKVPPRSTEGFGKEKASNMDRHKERINTLLLVSTLIVTVTFAAGFSVPGGSNSSEPGQGMAVMLHRTWFKLFILCITVSQYAAISATLLLISAYLGDVVWSNFALPLASFSVVYAILALSLSFLAGLHLVITDLSWLATASLVIGVYSIVCIVFFVIVIQFEVLRNLNSGILFYLPLSFWQSMVNFGRLANHRS